MDMVVLMVLSASCFFSVAVNEYSSAVGKLDTAGQVQRLAGIETSISKGFRLPAVVKSGGEGNVVRD